MQYDLTHNIYKSSTNVTLWICITSKVMMLTMTPTGQVQPNFIFFFMKTVQYVVFRVLSAYNLLKADLVH